MILTFKPKEKEKKKREYNKVVCAKEKTLKRNAMVKWAIFVVPHANGVTIV